MKILCCAIKINQILLHSNDANFKIVNYIGDRPCFRTLKSFINNAEPLSLSDSAEMTNVSRGAVHECLEVLDSVAVV